MPQLSDLQKDPATGAVLNAGDFTPGQLSDAMRQGLVSYQNGQRALASAAAPAPNAPDLAAAQAPPQGVDLRYGTNAQGQVNAPPAAAPAPAVAPVAAPPPAPKPSGPGIAYPTAVPVASAPGSVSPQLALLPPGAGVRPGWQPESRETTTTGKTSPYAAATDQALLGQMGARADLLGAQSDAASAQGGAAASVQRLTTLHDEIDAAGDRARQAHQVAELHDYHERLQGLIADANNTKINQNAWIQDKTPVQQALTVLGLAISGFGYGYSGRGLNPAEYINNQVKASVDAQMQNLNNKRAAVTDARQNLLDLKAQFGSDDAAKLAAELQQRQFYIAHLNEQAADLSAPAMNRLRAKQYAADLSGLQAQGVGELDKLRTQDIATKGAEKYNAPGAGGPGVGVSVTLADGSRRVLPLAMAKELGMLPADQLKTEETRANIAKTQAETKGAELKNASAGTGNAALNTLASGVASTAYDPTRVLDSSAAGQQATQNEAYNSALIATWHANHPGIRLSPELIPHVLGPALIQPGDTEAKVRQRKTLAPLLVGGQSSTPTGFQPAEGE